MSTVIESSKNVESKRVLNVRLERDSAGLRISLQSNLDWLQFARDKSSTFTLAGVECFRPKQERINGAFTGYFVEDNQWSIDDMPNLCLLLGKDINQGVTFNFGLVAVSEDRLKDWLSVLKQQVKMLYFTYLKPVEVRVYITSETVEREMHD